MRIFSIETSCDETAAALVEFNETTQSLSLLSNIVASSLSLHATTGGIIPEVAAREQIKYILPVLKETLQKGLGYSLEKEQIPPAIDAIAVTYGPGLIGSLLVGVETAKTLSYLWNKPLIPVNHLYGHIYANWLSSIDHQPAAISFPALALVVSGGHTDLVLMKNHHEIEVIGGTRDDAAGEAFDKIGRLLNLPYPAGPRISRLAERGNPKAFALPRPMIGSADFDFSFSGLKTAVLNLVKKHKWNFNDENLTQENSQLLADLCASVEEAIVDVLVRKTLKAAEQYEVKSILLGGGVAANQKLRERFTFEIGSLKLDIGLFVPPAQLCTDNAAMIAATAAFSHERADWRDLSANPQLYF